LRRWQTKAWGRRKSRWGRRREWEGNMFHRISSGTQAAWRKNWTGMARDCVLASRTFHSYSVNGFFYSHNLKMFEYENAIYSK
jgi:hypothetical protein